MRIETAARIIFLVLLPTLSRSLWTAKSTKSIAGTVSGWESKDSLKSPRTSASAERATPHVGQGMCVIALIGQGGRSRYSAAIAAAMPTWNSAVLSVLLIEITPYCFNSLQGLTGLWVF